MAEPIDFRMPIGNWRKLKGRAPGNSAFYWYHEPTGTYGLGDFSAGDEIGGYAEGDSKTFLSATHIIVMTRQNIVRFKGAHERPSEAVSDPAVTEVESSEKASEATAEREES
jgi:hypothetical protein